MFFNIRLFTCSVQLAYKLYAFVETFSFESQWTNLSTDLTSLTRSKALITLILKIFVTVDSATFHTFKLSYNVFLKVRVKLCSDINTTFSLLLHIERCHNAVGLIVVKMTQGSNLPLINTLLEELLKGLRHTNLLW